MSSPSSSTRSSSPFSTRTPCPSSTRSSSPSLTRTPCHSSTRTPCPSSTRSSSPKFQVHDDPPSLLLSLQDMCMLRIMLRLEEFPVQTLALLPLEIRGRLFLGLSHADILHLDGTALFSGVNMESGLSDENPHRPTVAREELLNSVLCGDPSRLLSLNLQQALDSQHENRPIYSGDLTKHISKCYPSLESTLHYGAILPKRSFQFTSRKLHLPSHLAHPLLRYCNMQSAPEKLKIDCCGFARTAFWKDYQKQQRKLYEIRRASGYDNPEQKMDPVIPFMQEFLSNVEILELGTDATPGESGFDENLHTVPYVLLYNIITSKQPHLKHLKVYGYPMATSWVLSTVAELLCNTITKSMFLCYTFIPLATPAPAPFLLEGLSVLPQGNDWGYPYDYVTASLAAEIAFTVKSIVSFQLQNLKNVTIHDLGFCYDDFDYRDIEERYTFSFGKRNVNVAGYRSLLSSLTDLLKQPQFHSLIVGKSPLPEAYELIETFLCTPATHKQSLSIEGIDDAENEMEGDEEEDDEDDEDKEEEDEDEDEEGNMDEVEGKQEEDEDEEGNMDEVEGKQEEDEVVEEEESDSSDMDIETRAKRRRIMKSERVGTAKISQQKIKARPLTRTSSRAPPGHPLPETNILFKCLDLGLSSSCVHSWLFSLPKLKLKKLKMRTQDMTLVPADMDIQVEHVAFSTQTYCSFHKYSYSPTVSTAHLGKFTISNPVLKQLEFNNLSNEYAPGLLPALNHCLSKLLEQGRGLEELYLNSTIIDDKNYFQVKELFIQVRDLSQQYATTVLLPGFRCSERLFADLGKEFKEKKIKKVIHDDNYFSPQFDIIAEEVIARCP